MAVMKVAQMADQWAGSTAERSASRQAELREEMMVAQWAALLERKKAAWKAARLALTGDGE